MTAVDTKSTILDVAEQRFADQGFAATSLRQVTTDAGVNLAAVNYHFGSKEGLVKAVLMRRIAPINDERRRRLDALPDPAPLEAVVRAYIEPAVQTASMVSGFCRVFGRLNAERPPFLAGFFREQFGELGRRFVAMLAKGAPALDAQTIWWRMHFTIGAMSHTLLNAHVIGEVSGGVCDMQDPAAVREQLVTFALGGFSQPPQTERGGTR